MKLNLWIFIVVVILLVAFGAPAQAPAPDTGRYQLLPATYEFESKGSIEYHGLFRIDTRTGKTWRFHNGMIVSDQGKEHYYRMWVQIDE